MKRIFTFILPLLAMLLPVDADAQYDRNYIYWVGRQCMMENNYREAIDVLSVLIRFDEKAYDAYFYRGIAKYNLDDLLGADADFTAAIEKNPVYTGAYYYRAITRTRLGNYDDALKDFQEAIDLRPDLPGPYYNRGVTRLLNQQFESAVDDFDKFIKQEKKNADAYINRGTSYLYLKDTVKAYDDYNMAIRTNRENPNGYNRRGMLYMQQKRYDEARADFDTAVACDSTYLLSYFNRAMVYSYTNRPMQSISDFDKVIELDSTSSLGYFNRGIVRSQIGDYNHALEDFDRVAMFSPDNVLVYFNRAMLYTRLGDIDAAISDYTRAIELYPDFANAYINRSILRQSKHDVEGARRDRATAQRKIAEYKSRLQDTTYSIYADTTQRFDRLLSFESKLIGRSFERIASAGTSSGEDEMSLIPMFRFTLMRSAAQTGAGAAHTLLLAARRGLQDTYRQPAADPLAQGQRHSARFARDARPHIGRAGAQRRRRVVGAALRARHKPVAYKAVHQCRQYLYGCHTAQPRQSVPLYEPRHHARRDDRLHLVDRQLLPAHYRRL